MKLVNHAFEDYETLWFQDRLTARMQAIREHGHAYWENFGVVAQVAPVYSLNPFFKFKFKSKNRENPEDMRVRAVRSARSRTYD